MTDLMLTGQRTLDGCAYCFDIPDGHLHQARCENGEDAKHHRYVSVRAALEVHAALDIPALRSAIYAVSVRHDWANRLDAEDRTEEIAAEYAANVRAVLAPV